MKSLIKKIIPKNAKELYIKKSKFITLNKLYDFDKKRFKEYAYNMKDNLDMDNLRSKITFHYHSIEKGLSNPAFRFNFGETAFTQLFLAMDKYLELNYPTEDSRFQQAISVIENYIIRHEENNINPGKVKIKFEEYKRYKSVENMGFGGALNLMHSELPQYHNSNFKDLALNRYSVRDFGEDLLNDSDIKEAVEIAIKTPSACNRQSSKVYHIKEKKLVQELFQLQGGLTTHGINLQSLLLVTSDRKYMNGPHERNQTYIDGGMFLMSLVYGLTYKNIATCTLNTNFNVDKEIKVREILNIPMSQDLIAFVALGSFPEEFKVASSPRDQVNDVLIVK